MTESPADRKPPRQLPEELAIFPLTGALLLPGTVLPLQIFEPRYRKLVEDALAAEAVFGMIQPMIPRQDSRPQPGVMDENPELYDVGCAGWIDGWKKFEDGRYVLQLAGMCRFRVRKELPLYLGYRRVRVDYGAFPDILDQEAAATAEIEWKCERDQLLAALREYGDSQGLNLPFNELDSIADLNLVNALSVALPFRPEEKQALLEAPTLSARETVLLNLLKLSETRSDDKPGPAPVN